MERGFLIHAYNNLEIDYGTMAVCCALLIKKNLRINTTCLVTSPDTLEWIKHKHGRDLVDRAFDLIKIVDVDRNVATRKFHDTRYSAKEQPYYNTNRADSFDLSPFDETILIDSDYLVLDQNLDNAWGSHDEMMVNRSVRDLSHTHDLLGFDSRFNDMSIPLYWATVVYFKKTEMVRSIFRMISFIRENYHYYQNLYQFSPNSYFRNDYALSIALHMVGGQIENDSFSTLPTPFLLFSTEHDDMIDFRNGEAIFISEPTQGRFSLHRVMTSVHVMNKWSINRISDRIIKHAID